MASSSTASTSQSHPQPPSVHEKLQELDQVPLLMKSLPDGHTDNHILSALQSLAHDGTPDGGYSQARSTCARSSTFF